LADETHDCAERLCRLNRCLAAQSPSSMRPSDVTIYLRWLHHHQSSTQRLDLFFQRLMWLASVHRFDVSKQCHQHLRRKDAKVHTEFYVTGSLRKSKSTCHWVEVTVSARHPSHCELPSPHQEGFRQKQVRHTNGIKPVSIAARIVIPTLLLIPSVCTQNSSLRHPATNLSAHMWSWNRRHL
jgi:hypothetical protein